MSVLKYYSTGKKGFQNKIDKKIYVKNLWGVLVTMSQNNRQS